MRISKSLTLNRTNTNDWSLGFHRPGIINWNWCIWFNWSRPGERRFFRFTRSVCRDSGQVAIHLLWLGWASFNWQSYSYPVRSSSQEDK